MNLEQINIQLHRRNKHLEELLEQCTHDLHDSDMRFRSLAALSSDLVWEMDASCRYTYVSPRITEVFGYTETAWLGRSFWSLVAAEDVERIQGLFQAMLNQRQTYLACTYDAHHSAGYRLPVASRLHAFYTYDGTLTGFCGVHQDLTDHVQHASTNQDHLQTTRSYADIEQFIYVVSHDLREPLRTITSYVNLLAERYRNDLDARARDIIGFTVDATTRMQRLISDLLAFSRIDTRGQHFLPTDCNQVYDQVLAGLAPLLTEQAAILTCSPLPTLLADAQQLAQLFAHLIDNALKFRSTAPPRIHISAERTGNDWLFAVRDNGIGIASQHHERIFQIFQRLHNREYPGTGIGLAICQRIVQRHGGQIQVQSQPGEGTTIFFTLPALNEQELP